MPPATTLLQCRVVGGHRRPRAKVHYPRHDVAQCGQSRGIGGADDGAQNHLKGDLGHLGPDRELHTHRPAGDVGGGDLGHHVGLAGYGVARERGHHQATPVAVDIVVDDENGAVAQDSGQHRVRFAGVEYRRIAGEHGLDVGGVGQVDHRSHRGHAQREHLAVAAPARGHHSWPVAQHQRGLDRTGQRWSRRQLTPG